uniref:Enoyl-[acyl-carrier-protein] reductase, mitochondrial n=1 Tax=Timema poppense TaxID=170557 RepID=A0A7R9H0L5_TIMPO|nr:unnamed protein product [Timema poppensis]
MASFSNILTHSFKIIPQICIYSYKSTILHTSALNMDDLGSCQARSISSQKLVFSEFGDPAKVVRLETEELPSPKSYEVLVRMLAAPLNPADINTIQGVYPAKPPLPAVPGNEGVGEILSVGSDVKNLRPGDRVIPKEASAWGTWRSHAVSDAQRLSKIPKEIGIVEAATMSVNPSTAYRMLKDFVKLSAGDTVIQNGANSAAGQNVIQLCNVWGLISVNIVRDRPNIDELKIFLKNLGATHILTEQELSKTDIFKSKAVSKAKLALNCVGGKSAVEVLRQLDHKGVMVTYGGMSREPVTLPTSSLIFKDISARGFWMSRWTKEHQGTQEQETMQRDIAQLLIDGKLRAPIHKLLPLRDYQEAINSTLNAKGFTGLKYIFDFQGLDSST